jgi:hypothetical protein
MINLIQGQVSRKMSVHKKIVICKPIGWVGIVEKPLVDAQFGVFENSTGPLENFLEPFQIGEFRKTAPERTVILRWKSSFQRRRKFWTPVHRTLGTIQMSPHWKPDLFSKNLICVFLLLNILWYNRLSKKDAIPIVQNEGSVAKKKTTQPHWSIQQMRTGRKLLFFCQV